MSTNNKNEQILIIDDDKDILDTLRALLEYHGYQVFSCSDAQEAQQIIEQTSLSTIIVDIFLPDVNGIEFISRLQDDGITTPVIIITGSSDIEFAQKAIRLGVFDYLVKPFKNVQLQRVVGNAILKNTLLEERKSLEQQKILYQQELERMVDQKVNQLKESERKYQNLVEQSLVGVYIIRNSLFRYTNKKMCSILECDETQLIDQKGLIDFAIVPGKKLVQSNLERIQNREVESSKFRVKALSLRGNERILEVYAGAIEYQGQTAIEGIVLDVTEENLVKSRQQQFELELMNEHKMAAIGQLATGISHNLNTPISIIQGNAELLQLQMPESSEVRKILNQTAKMSELITTLIGKSRKDQLTDVVAININDLLQEELDILNANLFFKHKVEKEYYFAAKIPVVEGVYSDFSQSFRHIIQNAIDAVYDAQVRKISITTRADETELLVLISDTGPGIKKEDQSKIFTPFYSTKPKHVDIKKEPFRSRGTGLGLSLAYNLLKPYGIKIEFDCPEAGGTTFRIRIPVHSK